MSSPLVSNSAVPDPEDDPPFGYRGARRRVEEVVRDDARAEDLAERARRKADKWRKNGRIARLWEPLSTSIRLLRAYARREYRSVPWRTIAALGAALLYMVNPLDLLPDVIPFLGVIDDAAVLAWAFSAFTKDLAAFRDWERDGERPAS